MEKTTIFGTVSVPSAGLTIGVSTCDETDTVRIRVSRHGIPAVLVLSQIEAWELGKKLRDAALSI